VSALRPDAKPTHPTQEYLASRPPQWENDAIALMIRLSEEIDVHVHIVHFPPPTLAADP
jgi:allantoinase